MCLSLIVIYNIIDNVKMLDYENKSIIRKQFIFKMEI